MVSTGDLHGRIDRWIRLIQAAEPAKAAGGARSTLYARPELAEALVAPRTETEKVLAEIWREALGLAEVGVNDDYFELGGDSVLGLRIVAKANEAGLRMTGRHIFEHHTIAELGERAGRSARAAGSRGRRTPSLRRRPAETTAFPGARLDSKDLEAFLAQLEGGGATRPSENVEDIYELSPMQQGMLFHALREPDSPDLYLLQVDSAFRGPLDTAASRPGLAAGRGPAPDPAHLVPLGGGRAGRSRSCNRQVGLPLREEDWRGWRRRSSSARHKALVVEERRRFDLERAPLMRLA